MKPFSAAMTPAISGGTSALQRREVARVALAQRRLHALQRRQGAACGEQRGAERQPVQHQHRQHRLAGQVARQPGAAVQRLGHRHLGPAGVEAPCGDGDAHRLASPASIQQQPAAAAQRLALGLQPDQLQITGAGHHHAARIDHLVAGAVAGGECGQHRDRRIGHQHGALLIGVLGDLRGAGAQQRVIGAIGRQPGVIPAGQDDAEAGAAQHRGQQHGHARMQRARQPHRTTSW
ncbi:hypothetical protein QE401_004421 [Pseudoroseomonas cervicalis]|nr:hypothetical protein [Pseudoroseomonas cervicalis]MDQ1081828.1 hypothetical protein [Pseudoroseomonas cervicalis]